MCKNAAVASVQPFDLRLAVRFTGDEERAATVFFLAAGLRATFFVFLATPTERAATVRDFVLVLVAGFLAGAFFVFALIVLAIVSLLVFPDGERLVCPDESVRTPNSALAVRVNA